MRSRGGGCAAFAKKTLCRIAGTACVRGVMFVRVRERQNSVRVWRVVCVCVCVCACARNVCVWGGGNPERPGSAALAEGHYNMLRRAIPTRMFQHINVHDPATCDDVRSSCVLLVSVDSVCY